MRNAPPVAVTCDGGLVWDGLLAALPAAAAAALAGWLATWADLSSAGVTVSVLAAATAAAVGAWRWRNTAASPLAWDGACWRAGSPPGTGQVEIMIDLGRWLLLRFRPEAAAAPAQWLAVSAATAGGALHGLRVALHGGSPGPAVGPNPAERQPG